MTALLIVAIVAVEFALFLWLFITGGEQARKRRAR